MRITANQPTLGFSLLFLSSIALAQSTPPAAATCVAIADDARRLACYDSSFGKGPAGQARSSGRTPAPAVAPGAAANAPPATTPGAAANAPPATTPRAAVNPVPAMTPAQAANAAPAANPAPTGTPAQAAQVKAAGAAAPEGEFGGEFRHVKPGPKSLNAVVTDASPIGRGMYRLTLDNGQVWDTTQADWSLDFHPSNHVTLSRMALGNYLISRPGNGHTVAIRRVQ